MQPEWLCLEPLGIQIGRPLCLFLGRPNVPSDTLDKMTPTAILLGDELPSIGDGLRSLVTHLQWYWIRHQADKHARNYLHIFVAKPEVRHFQEFFRSLDPAHFENAGIFQLLFVPGTARMLNGQESEVELRNQFASCFRQFRSDGLRFFKSRNVVVSEESIASDQAFSGKQIFLF